MPNLLVVEDDAAIGSVLESTLRLHGYQVCWRRDGRGALHAATLGDFDLVLLDLGLPDLDGVEVCRRLRAALPAKEFDLLARLAEQPGVAVSRETLMSEVWDAHWYGSTKTLDVHIAALRRKLSSAAEAPGEVPRIATLRGHGYRLEDPARTVAGR